MRSIYFLKFLTILSFLIFGGCRTYKLPDAKMKPLEICGFKKCQPGNLGDIYQFNKKPYSLTIDSLTNLKDVATSIIGHTLQNRLQFDGKLITCSNSTNNPFSPLDVVNLVYPDGKYIDYIKNEKIQIDVNMLVNESMKQIKETNNIIDNLDDIEDNLRSYYKKINNNQLTIQAKYSEWGLSQMAIERLLRDEEYFECKTFLEDYKLRIITAVGIISFDISFNSSAFNEVIFELDNELKKYGITANLSLNIEKEVTKNLKTFIKGGYQIVVWRSALSEDLFLKRNKKVKRTKKYSGYYYKKPPK